MPHLHGGEFPNLFDKPRATKKRSGKRRRQRSYERRDVQEAQSNLALLFEVDRCAFDIVSQFIETWCRRRLSKGGS